MRLPRPSRLLISALFSACAAWLLAPLVHGAGRSHEAHARIERSAIDGLSESSALARSQRRADVFWTLNDSGNPAELYALDTQGRLRGRALVDQATNQDWESLASFREDGHARLLIADVGDNFAQRPQVTLYVVDEPRLDAAVEQGQGARRLALRRRIDLRYPDGPRDCEAVFVDDGFAYLLSKRDPLPQLYRVPLHAPPSTAPTTAEALGTIEIPRAPALTLWPHWINWITGIARSVDGRHLAVLTPSQVHVYTRTAQESWPAALQRSPASLPLPMLAQAEAVAWSADGRQLYVTSEGSPTPLARLDAPAETASPTSSR